jgi:hypothetical protein
MIYGMELAVPLEKFNPTNVHYDASQVHTKSFITFSYSDDMINLSNIILLLPPTRIISYQSSTGKLILDMKEHTAIHSHLRKFQEDVYKYILSNHKIWFPEKLYTAEQLDTQFQKCVSQNVLILYCPTFADLSDTSAKPIIPVFCGADYCEKLISANLVMGQTVQFAIKITGISLQMENRQWTGKYRLQHKIHAVYIREDMSPA